MTAPPIRLPIAAFAAAFALTLTLALTLAAGAQTAPDAPAATTDRDDPGAAVAAGPDMDAIVRAYQAGDFVTARAGLAQLAPDGTANAKYRYGRILYEGRGGPRDLPGAARWLTEAVEADHTAAATLLAEMYLQGAGVEKNPERALNLLERAGTRGDSAAQFLLAMAYRLGQGTPRDPAKAFNWFLAAAENDHAQAQYALSQAYAAGSGVGRDDARALSWMLRAAENGLAEAQFYYAANLDSGLPGAAPDPQAALAWYRRAAESGHAPAMRVVGTRYLTGAQVAQDSAEALRWLHAAAQAGDVGAMYNLGHAAANGLGMDRDDAAALDWYRRAADRGMPRAKLVLGALYETGRGTAPDPRSALEQYREALELGEATAALRLGAMAAAGLFDDMVAPQTAAAWVGAAARQGDAGALGWLRAQSDAGVHQARGQLAEVYLGQPDRVPEALDLFRRAAAAGDSFAQFRLGRIYSEGAFVEQDYVQAHMWFNLAATHGLSDAADMRELVSRLMTRDQIAAAQALARDFFAGQSAPVPGAATAGSE